MTFIRPALAVLMMLLLTSATALAATTEQALTVEQIIALSRAGVSDAVIIAMINRDKPVFVIDTARAARLQQDCLSAPLIRAMVTSGRPHESRQAIAPTTTGVPSILVTPAGCVVPPTAVPTPPTSTRGIFFAQPTRGIFFPPAKR